MAKISRIEPLVPILKPRKRVAAYARVSLDTEQLLHSLSAQVSYYSSLIQKNPKWEYAGVYADEGITGTSTGKRDDFKRLIADCDAGKIDLVIVKSISRFARDTVDTLNATRHLKELGIDVYFERERIHSMSDEGELMLTLLASFAQEESRSISENVKWGIRKRFKEGIANCYKAPFGYEWDGQMFRIIPEQGEIVKEIYRRYLAGESAYSIAKDLKQRGVVGQSGVPLEESTIKNILTSESYMGIQILQKNYISENHKRMRNKGELPRYAVEDMYEPLVSEEDLMWAISIREKRADACPNKNPKLTAFSGIMRCGICGCSISRRTSKYGKRWVCNTRERKGMQACELRPLYETELMDMTCKAIGIDSFDESKVKSQVALITVNPAFVEFRLKSGNMKQVMRKYKRGNSAFSQKIECGCCGNTLESDTWRMGPAGHKESVRLWNCRNCKAKRLLESELIKASKEIFDSNNYEGLFAQHIKKAVNFDEKIEFIFKGGDVRTWQKE